MPLPRSLARVNRRVTNRLLGGLVMRLPWFGVVVHTGRTSRRRYRTPVNVFRRGDRFIIALTYGSNADWVRMSWQRVDARSRREGEHFASRGHGSFMTRVVPPCPRRSASPSV